MCCWSSTAKRLRRPWLERVIMDRARILVVGSHIPGLFMRVKRPPVPGETVIGWGYQEPMDGGKGSNQAIAAARLGGRVSFVGCVGKDRIGDEGLRWMAEAGVDTGHVRQSERSASGIGFILLDESGVPAMVSSLGANAEITSNDVEITINSLNDTGVLLTQFEIPIPVALEAAEIARRRGLLVIINPAPAPETEIIGLDCANILVPNETEARLLLGLPLDQESDGVWLAQSLKKQSGARSVLVTLGERGVAGCDAEGSWQTTAPRVPVVDTSGAGDVFCAALAVALLADKPLRDAADWACQAAALSVTREGTIPAFPTDLEVEAFVLQNRGIHNAH